MTDQNSPLRVHHRLDGRTMISVHHPDSDETVNVGVTSDIWPDHIAPAIAALNKHIAGWPVGPFTVDEVRAAA